MTQRKEWESKFLDKISTVHKRNKDKVVTKVMKRIDSWKSNLKSRSKKYDVECFVTLEELRTLMYENYGTPCRYCGKILTIKNIAIDHILPISKGGSSNKENLQVICKTSNSMKGSLQEDNFELLLEWLREVPEELSKDISIRLSRGII